MDTLKNYLEGMFAGLGNSPEVLKAKEELLSMMEDKYNELRQQGLNNNTAIGQVITEFGNLEELAEVLGIQQQVSSQDELLTIEPHTVDTMVSDYLKYYPKYGYALVLLMVGVSIFLSFVAISQAPSFTLLNENEMIATAIYLGWSFLTNNWHITWLVWPIAGILYSGIQMIINYQNQKKAE